ncbi:hypothetical protein KJ937_03590 [Patescibacteria group bacterium]|nr:hypothetical protein [Patescibacteria group bacterium]
MHAALERISSAIENIRLVEQVLGSLDVTVDGAATEISFDEYTFGSDNDKESKTISIEHVLKKNDLCLIWEFDLDFTEIECVLATITIRLKRDTEDSFDIVSLSYCNGWSLHASSDFQAAQSAEVKLLDAIFGTKVDQNTALKLLTQIAEDFMSNEVKN